jgi:hypothetical protein
MRVRIKLFCRLGDDARLLGQKILRLARQGLEQALNARDVARGLGQARENCCSAE